MSLQCTLKPDMPTTTIRSKYNWSFIVTPLLRSQNARRTGCTATLSRCHKRDSVCGSWLMKNIWRPSSWKNAVASTPTGPSVSMAIGTNWYRFVSSAYFAVFLHSASLATSPGPVTARFKWLAARVYGHVKSHEMHFPRDHGIVDTPSGSLSSLWQSLTGSSRDGICAASRARWIMWLMALWRARRPADLRQLRPWVPLVSTTAPQMQRCSEHTGAPDAEQWQLEETGRRVVFHR